MDFGGFDSSIILNLRGVIPKPIGNFSECLQGLSQAILVGIILVGRLGVHGLGTVPPAVKRTVKNGNCKHHRRKEAKEKEPNEQVAKRLIALLPRLNSSPSFFASLLASDERLAWRLLGEMATQRLAPPRAAPRAGEQGFLDKGI